MKTESSHGHRYLVDDTMLPTYLKFTHMGTTHYNQPNMASYVPGNHCEIRFQVKTVAQCARKRRFTYQTFKFPVKLAREIDVPRGSRASRAGNLGCRGFAP
eukprot:GHVU01112607.1.p1 GENE.GHVU01112607.1~~GHVU01112607.1.p1  ORF type:complete len:101 (-),score=2.79 GHVU01112607.1:773-1075(-)